MPNREIQTGYGVEGDFEDTSVTYEVSQALAEIMQKLQDEHHMVVTVKPSDRLGQVTVTIEKNGTTSIKDFEVLCSRVYNDPI